MPEAVALEIPAAAEVEVEEEEEEEGSPSPPVVARVPPRIRRRLLLRHRGGAPATAEEIEAKLREADLRRQVGRCDLSAHPARRFRDLVLWVFFFVFLGDLIVVLVGGLGASVQFMSIYVSSGW